MIQSPGIYSQPRLMVPTIPGNTSIRFRVSTCSIAALCAAAALFLSACSTPMEDVRVTLCKDLVRIKRGDEVVWKEVRTETPGYNDAVVRLNFSASGDDGSAACYYAYNAVDDTALALSDPLSSYATSPSKMQLDGRSMALIF
ncbi:hypothetical protein [Thiorhodovibrio litoralis]|uniref:hypothetical protein n=1 Tax=Thiorhodovibrio litoralis TaxID=2952932 RepID=UPI002B25A350|nr:hypothetical protein [Thiorhodovibrio litoralis]WPL13740.1 hypothetical protein Thiosp_03557 [Thiorhodovibrio litoralis]